MLLVLGAQAKSKEKFGLKVMGSWEDSVAASVASGRDANPRPEAPAHTEASSQCPGGAALRECPLGGCRVQQRDIAHQSSSRVRRPGSPARVVQAAGPAPPRGRWPTKLPPLTGQRRPWA